MVRISTKQVVGGFLLALGTCGLAQAGTTYTYTYDYQWSLASGCADGNWHASCGLNGGKTGSSVSPSPAPADPNVPPASIGASATGWANTQGNQSTTANQTLEKGQVQAWGTGLGVRNLDYSTTANGGESLLDASEGSSPEHAVDNNERYDSILYSFDKAISLTEVSISWYSGDSDITVLAYTDTVNPFNVNTKLAGLKYSDLLTNGWSLIGQNSGQYSNLASSGNKTAISTNVSSSYWLIGAANPLVGGSVDGNKDNIKIASLGGTITTQYTPQQPPPPNGVPEPGSLALLALGGVLLMRGRFKS